MASAVAVVGRARCQSCKVGDNYEGLRPPRRLPPRPQPSALLDELRVPRYESRLFPRVLPVLGRARLQARQPALPFYWPSGPEVTSSNTQADSPKSSAAKLKGAFHRLTSVDRFSVLARSRESGRPLR